MIDNIHDSVRVELDGGDNIYLGKKQYQALAYVVSRDLAGLQMPASKTALANEIRYDSTKHGLRIVTKMIDKGLIQVDPDHPDTHPQSNGAIVPTSKGIEVLNIITDNQKQ